VDDHRAAMELVFVGTHTGEFSGVTATDSAIDVPYSLLYDLDAHKVKALRIYMPMDQHLAKSRGVTESAAATSTA
jgi:hypothetical protein